MCYTAALLLSGRAAVPSDSVTAVGMGWGGGLCTTIQAEYAIGLLMQRCVRRSSGCFGPVWFSRSCCAASAVSLRACLLTAGVWCPCSCQGDLMFFANSVNHFPSPQ